MNQTDQERIIHLVCRQTDYSLEYSKQKLEQNGYDYVKVIKEYMQPVKPIVKSSANTKTVNQQIYSALRSFLDASNNDLSVLNKQRSDKSQNPTLKPPRHNISVMNTIVEENEDVSS